MSRRSWVVSVVAFIVLSGALNLYFAVQQSDFTRSLTSYGTGPLAHGALFDVLLELHGREVERSLTRPRRLGTQHTLWLIEPGLFASGFANLGGAGDETFQELDDWVRRGGTALVVGSRDHAARFFSLERDEPGVGEEPARTDPEVEDPEAEDPDASATRARARRIEEILYGRWEDAPAAEDLGTLVFDGLEDCAGECARGRKLDLRRIETFDGPLAQGVAVRGSVGGRPFVLEQERGAGRLVAIASGRFLSNQRLGRSEGALIALDLVRAYGVPLIDETSHGFAEEVGLFDVLSGARLALLAVVLFGVGIALVLWQRRWPPRALVEPEGPEPSLDAFVRSLGNLYSKSRDYTALLGAYRRGVLYRLQALLPGRTPWTESALRRRIEADPAVDEERRRWLLGGGPPARSERDLFRGVQELERYAKECE